MQLASVWKRDPFGHVLLEGHVGKPVPGPALLGEKTLSQQLAHDKVERGLIEIMQTSQRIEEEDSAALRAESPLDGHELMEICGRKPGFWIGRVKDRLSEMVLDGEIEPGDKGSATRIALQMFGPDRDSEGES